ncbi:MAG: hypothetical protein JRN15_21230, partial [Nitrososphaerota archaeon]|nr:hypothetical protein [Nitrososphaerota archaeon]
MTTTLMDGEFENLRGDLADLNIALNTTARDEHVGDVERYIRTIKERMRAVYNTLPYRHMPPRLIIEMAKHAVFWLNAFRQPNGIGGNRSPRSIIVGTNISYSRHCKYQFGEYVQTHEEHDNSMMPRTIGALALRPTGNVQGSFYFFSLSTGRVIVRGRATPLPMPDDVIDQVHRIARRQKANIGLMFADRAQNRTEEEENGEGEDEADNESYSDDESSHNSEEEWENNDYEGEEELGDVQPNDQAGNEDEPAQMLAGNDEEEEHVPGEIPGVQQEVQGNREAIPEEIAGVHEEEVAHHAEQQEIPGVDEDAQEDNEAQEMLENAMDAKYGPRSGRYNLRNRRERDYSHLFTMNNAAHGDPSKYGQSSPEQESGEDTTSAESKPKQGTRINAELDTGMCALEESAEHHSVSETTDEAKQETVLETPQMSMNQGIRMFGEAGVEAVKKEMQQLHDRQVMKAKQAKELTKEQKKEALAYLMFLKRKRGGKIKGRGCADGRKQRAYTAKEDAASPTVANEAVFLTAVIDAMEGREVAVFDVPGAFMQADMDELVHVRFTGKMVELLLEIDMDMYGPCVTTEGRQKVMYVELLKALYGTLRAARLFWEKLSGKLIEWGFTMNPYDSCVANKMMNGKQLTVVWHVDDLKVSHKEMQVLKWFAGMLNEEFGKETSITESYGKQHEYLGMQLDYSHQGEVKITMGDYTKLILQDVPEDMRKGTAATPAGNHLFRVNEKDPQQLGAEEKETFVHIVMQLLYLSQRARPDIRTAVSFLCGRLNRPDSDDYKKLCRVIKYLRGTIDLPLRLCGDGSGTIRWWVDASYAVHADMKGHTGGTLSLGRGSVYSTSTKQKLVARSSTESEVIGVHDVMPQTIWTNYFLQAQGVNVEET